MPEFLLPTNLLRSAESDSSCERREWIARLAETVGELAQLWSLQVGEPYQPGGQCSWVAPARNRAGQRLVLKVAWRHDEAEHEADGLRAWSGRGAVLLHDAHVCGSTSALLLERCQPGTPLGLSVSESEQDEILAGLLQRLWSAPSDGFAFRSLQVMCDAWATELEQRLTASPGLLDPGLARAGVEMFRGLPATAERNVLLATDLHAGNVLAAQRESWLFIDPKPYVGDPAYDVVQHMLNCQQRLAADPAGLARRMADLVGLERERVTKWLFARCVQESLDQPWLDRVAIALAATIGA